MMVYNMQSDLTKPQSKFFGLFDPYHLDPCVVNISTVLCMQKLKEERTLRKLFPKLKLTFLILKWLFPKYDFCAEEMLSLFNEHFDPSTKSK